MIGNILKSYMISPYVTRLEIGNWKLETGIWKLETGNWKLEAGIASSPRLDFAHPTRYRIGVMEDQWVHNTWSEGHAQDTKIRYEDSVKCSHFKRHQVLFKYPSYRLSAHVSYHQSSIIISSYSCAKASSYAQGQTLIAAPTPAAKVTDLHVRDQRCRIGTLYESYDSELHALHTTLTCSAALPMCAPRQSAA